MIFRLIERYAKPNLEIAEDIKTAFALLPKNWEDFPTIELLEMLQSKLPEWQFELVDEGGLWKYGSVDIKRASLYASGRVYLEVGNDFIEKNIDDQSELIKVLRAIKTHEDTHKQQYAENPNMHVDEDHYYEDPLEIDAHAREAAQELIDLGVDIDEDYDWTDSDTAFRYWSDYGIYENDENAQKIWKRFYEELKNYLED
jgi:hypothetical protein